MLVVLGILLVAALGWATWRAFQEPQEPVYDGKPVSYWIATMKAHKRVMWVSSPEYIGAVSIWISFPKGMATDSNAIPFLIKALNRQATPFGKAYVRLWRSIPASIQHHLPSPVDTAANRLEAACLLGEMGEVAKPAIPALIRALSNPDTRLRSHAASSLAQLGQADKLVMTTLVAALKDGDAGIRFQAARWPFRQWDGTVVTALTAALKDSTVPVRSEAARSLGRLGQRDESVITALTAALSDNERPVRRSATNALWEIDPEAAAGVGAKPEVRRGLIE